MLDVSYELNQNFKTSKGGWYNKGLRFPQSLFLIDSIDFPRKPFRHGEKESFSKVSRAP